MVMNSEENSGVRETLTQVLTAVSSEFQRRRKISEEKCGCEFPKLKIFMDEFKKIEKTQAGKAKSSGSSNATKPLN